MRVAISWPGRWLALVSAVLATAAIVGCGDAKHQLPGKVSTDCPPWIASSAVGGDQWSGIPVSVLPTRVRSVIASLATSVIYADTLDLDCDGVTDAVAQIVSIQGSLTFAAFLVRPDSVHTVLFSPSVVDGPEIVVLAADLSGDGHRDLVTWGSDEGGSIPRIFRWGAGKYSEVVVPMVYHVRNEELWGPHCRQTVLPAVTKRLLLVFSREPIPPTSLTGHGTECELPRDTLRLVADGLKRVHRVD